MPWQQHVADVALELDPVTGRLWYDEVVLTVPRQSGKTTLLLPKFVWRAEAAHLLGGRQVMLYAAQTLKDAIEKFDDDYVEDLAAARIMRGRYRVTNHQGRKRIRFQSGSLLVPVATGKASGHGKSIDDGTLDEAFAQPDARVEDAWKPAMITRAQSQMWITSTAGKNRLESPYLWSKVARGRKACEQPDPVSRFCYFEWSADPHADPQSPATWWSCMPALGFTQTEAAIRSRLEAALADEEGDGILGFTRPYLNRFDDAAADDEGWRVLERVQWLGRDDDEHGCLDRTSRRAADARPTLAVDVRPDRSRTAVAMAGLREDGLPMGLVTRYGEGTSWVAKYVADTVREKGVYAVVWDTVGPANSLKTDIAEQLGGTSDVLLHGMNTTEVTDACQQMYDAVVTEQFRHVGQKEVDDAVKGLAKRELGGGRFAWDRATSDVDISPFVAMTDAAWALKNLDEPAASFFGGGWR